jgi:[protein-PII] uridylyltransferase
VKKKAVTAKKQALNDFRASLKTLFVKTGSIDKLVKRVSEFCDKAILESWKHCALNSHKQVALIAMGSLGRRQLLPHSDLDLLILHVEVDNPDFNEQVASFIQELWDQGFKVGHQVATLVSYNDILDKEITAVTALMDKRLLAGSQALFDNLSYSIASHQTWHSAIYFRAKWREQLNRHKRFNQTAYNLEPNIKDGPGGLRDIQMISWIAHRHFGSNYLNHCLAMEFISDHELQVLRNCQAFLMRVRFALHLITNKDENRILFDYQQQLTELLGYKKSSTEQAVEAFMKRYFTVTKSVREINQLTLELFREQIFTRKKLPIKKINDKFQLTNNYLDVRSVNTFKHHPDALLSIFFYLNRSPKIKGIRGSTVRLIKKNKDLIDKNYRENSKNTKLFIELLKCSPNIFDVLDRMNRYGLLAKYIPEFRHVIGQMQYDLFHIYTVDQHSLFVVRNLMNFLHGSKDDSLRFALIKKIKQIELLYIAALFHDIGKGRGGCHSTIGATDAMAFCQRHRLSTADSELVSWLVQHHLLMSTTAQRKDIYEAETIKEFCQEANSTKKLDYLYLLTSADILATNPTLWSSWKESLLTTLYIKAKAYLELSEPLSDQHLVEEQKKSVINSLPHAQKNKVSQLLDTFNNNYFLHESTESISHQVSTILNQKSLPVVSLENNNSHAGSKLFIYSKADAKRLLIITTIISNYHLNIVEARIQSCSDGNVLDTYILLNKKNQKIQSKEVLKELPNIITTALKNTNNTPKLIKSFGRRRKKIAYLKPRIEFIDDFEKKRTELILKATDKKGLLATLSKLFFELNIKLYSAKIITTGDEVEDSFFLTTAGDSPLTESNKNQLKDNIISSLT